MTSWHAYPSIYNLGHKAVEHLLSLPHYIEEKVDGSQFSFGVFPVKTLVADGHHGHYGFEMESLDLRVRSKGAVMLPDAPEKMFTKAVETAKALKDQLTPGWTYRGEFLRTPSGSGSGNTGNAVEVRQTAHHAGLCKRTARVV